jgi:hypothetical protein
MNYTDSSHYHHAANQGLRRASAQVMMRSRAAAALFQRKGKIQTAAIMWLEAQGAEKLPPTH